MFGDRRFLKPFWKRDLFVGDAELSSRDLFELKGWKRDLQGDRVFQKGHGSVITDLQGEPFPSINEVMGPQKSTPDASLEAKKWLGSMGYNPYRPINGFFIGVITH